METLSVRCHEVRRGPGAGVSCLAFSYLFIRSMLCRAKNISHPPWLPDSGGKRYCQEPPLLELEGKKPFRAFVLDGMNNEKTMHRKKLWECGVLNCTSC